MLKRNVKPFFLDLREKTPELYQEFLAFQKTNGLMAACMEYGDKWGKKPDSLRANIWSFQKNNPWFKNDLAAGVITPLITPQQQTSELTTESNKAPLSESEKTTLTEAEVALLDGFKNGNIGFDKMQHELAYRVFKKILMYPDTIKMSDWLKSEVIKIQREEMSLKREQMEQSWAKLFGNFAIHKNCPRCGYNLQPKVSTPVDAVIVNEEQDDSESVGTSGSI